jgi:hypothetical protein
LFVIIDHKDGVGAEVARHCQSFHGIGQSDDVLRLKRRGLHGLGQRYGFDAAGASAIPSRGERFPHGKSLQKPAHRCAGKGGRQEQLDVHALQFRKRWHHIFVDLDLIDRPNL